MAVPPAPSRLLDKISEAAERLARGMEEGVYRSGRIALEQRGGVLVGVGGLERGFVVVGDLHGDTRSLETILASTGDLPLVLLGDYVDRAPPEDQALLLEAVLDQYLEGRGAVVLRGNHEPPRGLEPYPHDYPYALAQLYGREKGLEIYRASRRLFELLPYALVMPGLAIMLHGGPPTTSRGSNIVEYLGGPGYPPPQDILEEILWNDPSETVRDRAPSPRGAGSLWGETVTLRALRLAGDGRLIIRGHEPVLTGYKWNHGERVLTLFSKLGAPYHAHQGAYLLCGAPWDLRDAGGCIRTYTLP